MPLGLRWPGCRLAGSAQLPARIMRPSPWAPALNWRRPIRRPLNRSLISFTCVRMGPKTASLALGASSRRLSNGRAVGACWACALGPFCALPTRTRGSLRLSRPNASRQSTAARLARLLHALCTLSACSLHDFSTTLARLWCHSFGATFAPLCTPLTVSPLCWATMRQEGPKGANLIAAQPRKGRLMISRKWPHAGRPNGPSWAGPCGFLGAELGRPGRAGFVCLEAARHQASRQLARPSCPSCPPACQTLGRR